MTRTASLIVFVVFLGLILTELHFMGSPSPANQRLAEEQWRVLAVAQLDEDKFLVSVRYSNGDIRTYGLHISDPAERNKFLQAQQGLKKGRAMMGKARHGRAGLPNDSNMDFAFSDAPEAEPKSHE